MPNYRPNVCIVLTDSERKRVLVFRRVDVVLGPHRWQFPQGGLKADEDPEDGMRRELEEEIGTARVEVLQRSPAPLRYLFPPEVMKKLEAEGFKKGRYDGQEQHWFLARLTVGTEAIRFDNHTPEFDAFEWVSPDEALRRVVPFKREVYRQALESFGFPLQDSLPD